MNEAIMPQNKKSALPRTLESTYYKSTLPGLRQSQFQVTFCLNETGWLAKIIYFAIESFSFLRVRSKICFESLRQLWHPVAYRR
jgi:hypothetical protein